MDRRTLLRRGLLVASVGVAGCLGGGEGGNGSPSGGNGTNGTNGTNETDDGNATSGENATGGTGTENQTGNGSADTGTGNESTGNETGNATGGEAGAGDDSPAAVVTVGPDDELRFDPESIEIEAGDAVLWRWEDDGHNVKPTAQPDGAEWTGTPGDGSTLYDTGFEYTHTFDVPGEYEYVCVPHESMGMRGSLTVR